MLQFDSPDHPNRQQPEEQNNENSAALKIIQKMKSEFPNITDEELEKLFNTYKKELELKRKTTIEGKDGISRTIFTEKFISPLVKEHRIQIIQEPEATTVQMRLTKEGIDLLSNLFENSRDTELSYDDSNPQLRFPNKTIEINGSQISLSKGVDVENRKVATVKDILSIKIPKDSQLSIEQILAELQINKASESEEKNLEIQEQKRLFMLQNKLEIADDELAQIKTTESFPGYESTSIENRHIQLENEFGTFVFVNAFIGVSPEVAGKNLVSIVKSGGLLCANERYKRHLFSGQKVGFNPQRDMVSGGAEFVFTSVLSKKKQASNYTMNLIIDPKIADRLDWYAYPKDSYGSNPEEHVDATETPKDAVMQASNGRIVGEQFFKYGIGIENILCVACGNPSQREQLIQALKSAGITTVNEKSIEEWVVVTETNAEIFQHIGKKTTTE